MRCPASLTRQMTFMKALILLVTILSTAAHLKAQGKHDYVWLMGYGSNNPASNFGGTWIDFNSGEAEISFFDLPYHFGFDVPCSISDENGNLQFYTNGCRIMNYQHQLIENGDDLSPGWYQPIECNNYPYGYDGYQNFMILPRPGYPGRYIYFHYSIEPDFYTATTFYSEIDMNANNGLGKVVKKNEVLWELDTMGGSVSAVRHGNGRDWWVVIPEHFDNIFRLYLITPDTIDGPFIQDWNNPEASHVLNGWNTVFSPDGRKFVRTTNSFPPSMFVYDFDRCSGLLSDPVRIDVPDTIAYAPWAAISPNSRYLYLQLERTKLYQYDIETADIEASVQLVGEYDGFVSEVGLATRFHAMALAPNNKIYMSHSNGTNFLHTIHAPDLPGISCDFRQHDVEMPTYNGFFLPNFPNYRLYDVPGSLCDTLGINNVEQLPTAAIAKIGLSPNPASETAQIHLPQASAPYRICVFNLLGQLVHEENTASGASSLSITVSDWPSGAYLVQVETPGLGRWSGKLLVTHGKR